MNARPDNKRMSLALTSLLFLAVAAGSIKDIFNADVWWQLACGRWMVENRQIMYRDPFTFTVFGHWYTDFEWLFQVGLYGAYKIGKIPGMLIFKAFLLGLSAVGLLRCLSQSLSRSFSVALVLLVFWLSRFHNMIRADLITVCLFPWMLSLIIDVLISPNRGSSHLWKYSALFIAGTALWANCHGGFWLMGPPLFLAALAWIQRSPTISKRYLGNPFAYAILLFALAINFTPFGWRLPVETLAMIRQLLSGDGSLFIETLPTSFKYFKLYWIVLALTWLMKLYSQRYEPRVDAWTWGLLAYATWFGSAFARNVPVASMMSAIVLSDSVTTILNRNLEYQKWDRLSCYSACLAASGIALGGFFSMGWGLDQKRYPIAATDFIQQHIPGLTGYNDFNFGGYLLWRFYDEKRPIFLDSRCQAIKGYWEVFLAARKATQFSPEALSNWQDLMTRWPLYWCLIPVTPQRLFYKGMALSPMAYYFPKKTWALVFHDDRTALYVRRSGALKKMIDQYEIKNVYPDCGTAHPVMAVAWKDLFSAGS